MTSKRAKTNDATQILFCEESACKIKGPDHFSFNISLLKDCISFRGFLKIYEGKTNKRWIILRQSTFCFSQIS